MKGSIASGIKYCAREVKRIIRFFVSFAETLVVRREVTGRYISEFLKMGASSEFLHRKFGFSDKEITDALTCKKSSIQLDAELTEALSRWGFSGEETIDIIAPGVYLINKNRILKLSGNERVLKKEAEISGILQNVLNEYALPRFMKSPEGKYICAKSVLMERIEGSSLKWSWRSCDHKLVIKQCGRLLGHFHKAAAKFVPPELAPVQRLTDGRERILSELLSGEPSLFAEAKCEFDELERFYEDGRLVCSHGDMHFGNILEENGTVCGLIDFAECKRESPLFDISCFLIELSLFYDLAQEKNEFLELSSLFCREYSEALPLSAGEREHLPLFLDILCLRFFVYYSQKKLAFFRNTMMETRSFFANVSQGQFF